MPACIISISLDSKYDRDLIDKLDSIKRGQRSKYFRKGMKAYTEWQNWRRTARLIHNEYSRQLNNLDMGYAIIPFSAWMIQGEVDPSIDLEEE